MVDLLQLAEHHLRSCVVVDHLLGRGDMVNHRLMVRCLGRCHQLKGLVLDLRRLGVGGMVGVRGYQLEGLMFPLRSGQVVHMFLLRERSRQYLHVSQGEHLLRLLERNLDHGLVVFRDEVMVSGGRLLMPGIVVVVVSRRRLCKHITSGESQLSTVHCQQ